LFRIRGKFKNYSLICAHAPTEEKSEREKHQLYDRLYRMHKQCPSHNIKIILGEMNAKVGKEIWTGIAIGTLCSTKTKRPDISYVPLRQSCDVQLPS